jgi:ABC-type multidrug transport system ATPase subunit
VLTQQLFELDEIRNDRVSDVIGRQKTSYMAGGKEITPGQMLERMGFLSAQLTTQVKDLSGGQKRRLQLLLIVLDEPNVLILDEPTNDLDTDMLAAMEDLLDSFPGTLLVVSHDRYLIERVTDNQYAVMDGGFRHLPGGVDQYLEVRRKAVSGPASGTPADAAGANKKIPTLGGAELRNAQKELGSIDRKVVKLQERIAQKHEKLATHDQSDFAGLSELGVKLTELEETIATLETRWVELTELIES